MRKPFIVGAVVTLAVIGVGILSPSMASAWPPPTVTATGGTCTGQTGTDALARGLIYWTVTNHETAYPLSPATITAVKVTANFPTSWNTPIVLPNTGTSTAQAQTYVPASYSGKVTFHVEATFDGPDGHHGPLVAEKTVPVVACTQAPPPPPVVTTTTSTVPSTTTTTSTVATSTTVAVQAVSLPAPAAEPVAAVPAFTG